jgi:transcriptional regulator with XRE-family HTH domain
MNAFKDLRTRLRLSQEEIAEKLGLKQQNWSILESGDERFPVKVLAEALALNPSLTSAILKSICSRPWHRRSNFGRKK